MKPRCSWPNTLVRRNSLPVERTCSFSCATAASPPMSSSMLKQSRNSPQLNLDADRLTIGAAVSCRTVWENSEVSEQFSGPGGCGNPDRRYPDPGACNVRRQPVVMPLPAPITVPPRDRLRRESRISSAPRGARECAWWRKSARVPGRTSLADDEILVSPVHSCACGKLRRPHSCGLSPRNEMDIAVGECRSPGRPGRNGAKPSRRHGLP